MGTCIKCLDEKTENLGLGEDPLRKLMALKDIDRNEFNVMIKDAYEIIGDKFTEKMEDLKGYSIHMI